MRIYDKTNNSSCSSAGLLMPLEEAKMLSEELKELLKDPDKYIINFKGRDKNGNLTKEVVIRIYDENNLDKFKEPLYSLITTGKIVK